MITKHRITVEFQETLLDVEGIYVPSEINNSEVTPPEFEIDKVWLDDKDVTNLLVSADLWVDNFRGGCKSLILESIFDTLEDLALEKLIN